MVLSVDFNVQLRSHPHGLIGVNVAFTVNFSVRLDDVTLYILGFKILKIHNFNEISISRKMVEGKLKGNSF